jgi:hypothetical protein
LFEQPTVEELAETIAEGLRAELQVPPRIERAKRDGNLMPLSFAQQRLWFLDKLEQDSSFYNLSSTVRISGATLDVGALEKSLRQVTQRHEILRTTFTVIEGQPMQVISPESHFSLPLSDLSQLPPLKRNDWRMKRHCVPSICQPGRSFARGCCASRQKSTSCSCRCTTSSVMVGLWAC